MPAAAIAFEYVKPPAPPEIEAALQRLLMSMERPIVPADVRSKLLTDYRRHGAGHVTLFIRTITESEGNEGALVEPIVSAVSSVISSHRNWTEKGLAWVEAFDALPLVQIVDTMRGLDLFKEESLAQYLSWSLSNKLRKVFEPPAPPPKPKPGPKTGRKHNRNSPRYTKRAG